MHIFGSLFYERITFAKEIKKRVKKSKKEENGKGRVVEKSVAPEKKRTKSTKRNPQGTAFGANIIEQV